MIFTAPLGLLALAAIPAIVAIHLFRRRFPERRIAGLFLWQLSRATPEGGGKIAKLPVTASLILECAAALALALIVAGARVSTDSGARHLVVLLDDSASMSAIDRRGESARDRAVRRVAAELDRLGRGARVTLITSGDRPSVVAGPAAYPVEARAALDAWKPAAPSHPLALGVRLARELAGGSGRVLIVSDLSPAGRGEPEVDGALWTSVGVSLANVGIVSADRSISSDGARGIVSLTFANDGAAQERRHLDIVVAGKSVLARDLDLPPGVSSLTLSIPPGLAVARVTLSADALARDNEVTLAEPRPRIVGVANHLREGRGRQALSKALAAVTGITQAEPGHLAFVDAAALEAAGLPGVWRVGIGRPPPRWSAAGEPRDYVGPFVMEKRHPLLAGTTFGGVVWTGAAPVAATVRPLVSAGDAVLMGVPSSGAADSDVLLNLDLDRTNLIRSPDWPILISNAVEARRRMLPGPERWNYRIGEWVRVNLGRDPKAAIRVRSGAVERVLRPARQLEFTAPAPGGLVQVLEGSDVLFELGANFLDAAETDLRRQSTADSGAFRDDTAGLRGEGGAASDPLFWILLAFAAGALLANWWLLAPRRSAAA